MGNFGCKIKCPFKWSSTVTFDSVQLPFHLLHLEKVCTKCKKLQKHKALKLKNVDDKLIYICVGVIPFQRILSSFKELFSRMTSF